MLKAKVIYLSLLILCAIFIWYQMYLAQFDEYDANWGRIIIAFLVSLIASIIIVILLFRKTPLIKGKLLGFTIYFLLINSPITVFIFIMNYKLIFGEMLKVN
jgi:hypothetical protein